jgi:hypothetical protein
MERRTIANVPVVTTVTATGATIISANDGRSGFAVQNHGTNPLFVRLGAGATTSVYHIVLSAATALSDGKGAIYSQSGNSCYTGIVSAAGTGGLLTYLEY